MAADDSWDDPTGGDDAFDLDALDDAFDDDDADDPFGSGDVDREGTVQCPYCAESVELTLDPGSGTHQQYIEDCPVCCRPWTVSVSYDEDGTAHVFVDASDDHAHEDE
jgi:hypothetical protein